MWTDTKLICHVHRSAILSQQLRTAVHNLNLGWLTVLIIVDMFAVTRKGGGSWIEYIRPSS